jgi:hypothetical protein
MTTNKNDIFTSSAAGFSPLCSFEDKEKNLNNLNRSKLQVPK